MATTIISTDETTTQLFSTGDELILLEDASISVSSGDGVGSTNSTYSDIDLVIHGDIFASSSAIDLRSSVTGDGTGAAAHDIYIGATSSVGSLTESAVLMFGTDNIVTNYGDIYTLGSSTAGVESAGDDFSLRNYGTIMGGRGVELYNAGGVVSDANIVNHGDIQGEDKGIYAIDVALELFNTGTITAADDDGASNGIDVSNNNGTAGSVIHNTGTISGQTHSIRLSYNDNIVNNAGVLIGDVFFGAGNDTFNGLGGSVIGTVFCGVGDDTYIVDKATINLSENAAEGTDLVQSTIGWTLGDNFENLTLIGSSNINGYGNSESNTITGNAGDNKLTGRGGADTLFGGSGEDKIDGGNGIDNLFGGDEDDRLRGQNGFDVLKAEEGNDALYGGSGDDNLFGGNGNDILKGGMGKDKLYGGADADTFIYTKAAQSKNDSSADKIQDFELGIDTIDLSGVAAGTLTFIAGAAFSGTQGEVQVTGATNSTILVDVDGDGTADMKISVIGVTGLAEGDFVL